MAHTTFYLLALLGALAAANAAGERIFYLRFFADSCQGLDDRDIVCRNPGCKEVAGSDTVIMLNVDGVKRAQHAYYKPNTANPSFRWTTNIVDNVRQGALLTVQLDDYDQYDKGDESIGSFDIQLPADANSWDTTTFGLRGQFGNTLTRSVVGSAGSCDVELQYYAFQCEKGEYIDARGMCQKCDQGTYCSDGVTQLLCAVGTFASKKGQKSCDKCPLGTFQDTRGGASCRPCGAGKYQDAKGGKACKLCPAGYFGAGESSTRKTSQCDGKCDAGHVCGKGSDSATQQKCGSAGSFCTSGSSVPQTATNGYFTTPEGADEDVRTGQQICPKGFKCVNGRKIQCEASQFQSKTGQTNCETCSTFAKKNANKCDADYFRQGCGGTSAGTCAVCQFTKANPGGQQCAQKTFCKGTEITDTSGCTKCDCKARPDGKLQFKDTTRVECEDKCQLCSVTPETCNGDSYILEGTECTADGKTTSDATCKKCADEIGEEGKHLVRCGGPDGSIQPEWADCEIQKGAGVPAGKFLIGARLCSGSAAGGSVNAGKVYSAPDTTTGGGALGDCDELRDDPKFKKTHYMTDEDCGLRGDVSAWTLLSDCIPGEEYQQAPLEQPSKVDRKCLKCDECDTSQRLNYMARRCDHLDQSGRGNTVCLPTRGPEDRPGKYVSAVPTEDTDTEFQAFTDCATLGPFFLNMLSGNYSDCLTANDGVCNDGGPNSTDATCFFGSDNVDCGARDVDEVLAFQTGSRLRVGKDNVCLPLNECDERQYITQDFTATSDWQCGALTVCSEMTRKTGQNMFEVLRPTERADRVCAPCSVFTKGEALEQVENSPVYNQSFADRNYEIACSPQLLNTLSTAEIAAIAGAGAVALGALVGLGFVMHRKRRVKEEKLAALQEADRAKEDLDLEKSLAVNPLRMENRGGNNEEMAELVKSNNNKDVQILQLRSEVRRLKEELQVLNMGGGGRNIEMVKKSSQRKKQFGQTKFNQFDN